MANVSVPHWYFRKRVESDYHDWQEAITREFFQNSRDASAKNFLMGRWHDNGIYVYDDGCGMSANIILNKLLVLGAGHKPDGAVGGFGLAKELLFFSWPKWWIFTNDHFVQGKAGSYEDPVLWDQAPQEMLDEVEKLTLKLPFKTGTLIFVEFPEEVRADRILSTAYLYLQQCETKVNCWVSGSLVRSTIKKGRKAKSLQWCDVHHRKGQDNMSAIIRVNGIKMFEQFVGSGLGEIVFEITRPSIDVLTANRDGLRGQFNVEFENFISAVTRDRRTALKDKNRDHYLKLEGTGPIDLTPSIALDTEVIETAANEIAQTDSVEEALEVMGSVAPQILEQYKATYTDVEDEVVKDVVTRLHFLGYNPSFWIKYKGTKIPPATVKQFLKKRKAKMFAHLWTSILKQVLLDNELYLRFVAGFTFDHEEEAEYIELENKPVFLLNPRKNISSKRWQYVYKELRERAIHEIAHRRHPHHDEGFVMETDRLRRNCWKTEDLYKKLYFEARERFPTKKKSS